MKLKNLPKAFDGIRIGQISDIHSGSFWDKKAVKGGVEMLLKEKTDMIFFTGDLVNALFRISLRHKLSFCVMVFLLCHPPPAPYGNRV